MAKVSTTIDIRLADVIRLDGEAGRIADAAIQAGMFKIEKAYVEEAPGNLGDFKGGIRVKKEGFLHHVVKSMATTDRGFNYPLALYTGTGRLRGRPDYGFTTGRVRAGDVAYGIGGIRPNKAALRARKKSEKDFINFVVSKIRQKV